MIKFGLVSGLGRFEFESVKVLDYWLILGGLLLGSSMTETQEVSGSRFCGSIIMPRPLRGPSLQGVVVVSVYRQGPKGPVGL